MQEIFAAIRNFFLHRNWLFLFAEFYETYEGDKRGALQDYYTYGGMPYAATLDSHEEKSQYLKDLFDMTYIKDVLERHSIKNNTQVLTILLDILASGIGSLTNPGKHYI